MRPPIEIDVRPSARGGWEWFILTFSRGRMHLRAHGRAPYRWMARVDARRCLRDHKATFLTPYDGDRRWLDDIDLH